MVVDRTTKQANCLAATQQHFIFYLYRTKRLVLPSCNIWILVWTQGSQGPIDWDVIEPNFTGLESLLVGIGHAWLVRRTSTLKFLSAKLASFNSQKA
jgi:hypothetical protein